MLRALIAIIVLVGGTFATHLFMTDRGYVLVNFRGQSYETSVPGLFLILLLAYIAIRLLVWALRAPHKFGEAVGRQRVGRAKRKMTQGLIEMAEGNWARSEKILAQGARSSETPVLNYLNAARAAQLQGAYERRDNWLMLAYEQDEDAANAVLLTQAELQADQGQHEEALATLRKLDANTPGHTQGLALLASIYQALGDWDALRDLLPKLRRKKALKPDALDALALAVHDKALNAAGNAGDAPQVARHWAAVPKHLKKNPRLIHAYVAALRDSDQAVSAEKVLRKALAANWDAELLLDYGRLDGAQAQHQLSHAETWLKTHPEDPVLLLTAARLAMRNELWGKARSYLESSLAIEQRVDAYQLYGQLLQTMGETEGAVAALLSGLKLVTRDDPALPALSAPVDKT